MELMSVNNIRAAYDPVYKAERTITNEKRNSAAAKKDTLALSDTAMDYKSVMSALAKRTEVDAAREERVSRIKALMDEGRYDISSHNVAESILKLQ